MAKYNPKNVPDTDLLPPGIYTVKVASIKEKTDPALSENVRFTVAEPVAYKGSSLFKMFFLGTDEDPMAEERETQLGRGFRDWKKLLNAAEVAPMGDTEEEGQALEGQELHVEVYQYVRKKGEHKGETFNDIRSYYKLGSAEVGVEVEDQPTPSSKVKVVASASTIFCPKCKGQIDKASFGPHYATCGGEEQEAA